jgi:hypothetical protein
MAIMNFIENNNLVQLGNRNDFCYLCAKEIESKNELTYTKEFRELKGKMEGKHCVKFVRAGTETAICLEHIHKIAKDYPLPKETTDSEK